MTTLTITLDDSPEAQLIIQLLRQASVVTSVREDSSAEAADSLPPIRRGNKAEDPTALFGIWKDRPRTLEEIRRRNWDGRNQKEWVTLRASPGWSDADSNTPESI